MHYSKICGYIEIQVRSNKFWRFRKTSAVLVEQLRDQGTSARLTTEVVSFATKPPGHIAGYWRSKWAGNFPLRSPGQGAKAAASLRDVIEPRVLSGRLRRGLFLYAEGLMPRECSHLATRISCCTLSRTIRSRLPGDWSLSFSNQLGDRCFVGGGQ